MVEWVSNELEWDSERVKLWGVSNHRQAQRLLSTPPRGHNHGLVREGGWSPLDTESKTAEEDGFVIEDDGSKGRETFTRPHAKKPFEAIRHGTLSAYNNDKCRCERCRKALAEYRRARRSVQSIDSRGTK